MWKLSHQNHTGRVAREAKVQGMGEKFQGVTRVGPD